MLDKIISYSLLPVMDTLFLCKIYKLLRGGGGRMRRLDKCLPFYRRLTPCTFQPFLACGAYRWTDTHDQSKAPYTLSVKLSDFTV